MNEKRKSLNFFIPKTSVLDNFSALEIIFEDNIFKTLEAAYQYKKFTTSTDDLVVIRNQILTARSPYKVKEIVEKNKHLVPKDWDSIKVAVMAKLYWVKLYQHEIVQETLMASDGVLLLEGNEEDSFWGIGPDGNGENTSGRLWMAIRDGQLPDLYKPNTRA